MLKKNDTLLDTLQFLGALIEFFYLYKNDNTSVDYHKCVWCFQIIA